MEAYRHIYNLRTKSAVEGWRYIIRYDMNDATDPKSAVDRSSFRKDEVHLIRPHLWTQVSAASVTTCSAYRHLNQLEVNPGGETFGLERTRRDLKQMSWSGIEIPRFGAIQKIPSCTKNVPEVSSTICRWNQMVASCRATTHERTTLELHNGPTLNVRSVE